MLSTGERPARRDGLFVTFDVFSALIDSRTGGSSYFENLRKSRGWLVHGRNLYDEWDRRNKLSQRDTAEWITFTEHSRRALNDTYEQFGLAADARADAVGLLHSMSKWPLWPGVATEFPSLRERFTLGALSNVDDSVFERTAVASLVHADALLSSERLGAYKPAPEIYRRAMNHTGGRRLVHVATSARDVRGGLEAGIAVIRLVRPGHAIDPDGPRPTLEATSLHELATRLQALPVINEPG